MERLQLKEYLVFRLQIFLPIALLASLGWIALRPPSELSDSALSAPGEAGWRLRAAEFVSRVHGVTVDVDEVHFLPLDQTPNWYEAFHYVPVVFMTVPDRPPIEMPVPSNLPDLFYVELAVNHQGVPIDSRRFTNISRTALVRERLLGVHGTTVLLSAELLGQIQGLSLYDFSGDRSEEVLQEGMSAWLGDVMIGLDNLHNTGRWEGVDLVDFLMAVPTDGVISRQEGSDVILDFRLRGESQGVARFDLAQREIREGEALLTLQRAQRHVVGDLVAWAANWVRNLEWVGPQRMAVIEQIAFKLSDHIKRWLYDWFGYTSHEPIDEAARGTSLSGAPVIVTRSAEGADDEWPPPPMEPRYRFSEELENEGQWTVSAPEWVRRMSGAPEAFLQTYLRTDRDRPYAYVLIMAMDLRQMDIVYQQGTRHPVPSTGRRGSGEIPRDPETMDRVLGAFNGGFKTTHGAFASMASGVLYLEPMPWRATIAWSRDDEAIRMGTWGEQTNIPEDFYAIRQNMQPIYADDEMNPTNRRRWFGDNDADPITVRTGICMVGEHTLMYFWSELAGYRNIGRAMDSAGCEYGMHLDMNPYHTGWEFYRIHDFEAGEWESARPNRDMWFHRERYLESDIKDYFYILARETFDATLPDVGGSSWETDVDLPMTAEGFLPVAARLATAADTVRMVALDTSLLDVSFALGTGEPEPATGTGYRPQPTLELTNPLLMLSFDAADPVAPRGLTLDDWNYFPSQSQGVWLSIADRALALHQELNPLLPNRFELMVTENLEMASTSCSTMGYLADRDVLVFAWGPVRETLEAFSDLGVESSGVIGCGAGNVQLESLRASESAFEAIDLLTGDIRTIETLTGERSRFFFEPLDRTERIRRMFFEEGDVVWDMPNPDYEHREWHRDEL